MLLNISQVPMSPNADWLLFFFGKFQARNVIIALKFVPKTVLFVINNFFHSQILTFLRFILNAFIKSSSISSTGLPLSRNNDLASFKHLISNRRSNSDNKSFLFFHSKILLCKYILPQKRTF